MLYVTLSYTVGDLMKQRSEVGSSETKLWSKMFQVTPSIQFYHNYHLCRAVNKTVHKTKTITYLSKCAVRLRNVNSPKPEPILARTTPTLTHDKHTVTYLFTYLFLSNCTLFIYLLACLSVGPTMHCVNPNEKLQTQNASHSRCNLSHQKWRESNWVVVSITRTAAGSEHISSA